MSAPLYPSSRHDKPHARMYDHHLQHPAWRSLSGNAFKLNVMLLAQFRPNMSNSFPVGAATVSLMLNISEKTAKKVVDELIEKGHLWEQREGRNRGLVKTRERVASLTRYDTESQAKDPELPIIIWQKQKAAEKLPDEHSKKSGFENSNHAGKHQ